MIIEGLLTYFEITFISFLVNIIPAFVPPTWIILSLYKISNPELNILAIALFGVIGSVLGRLGMYYYSNVLGKYVPKSHKSNIKYIAKLVKGKKLRLFIITFLYSLSPLPSNFLFIISGISGMELFPIVLGFALGRILSYSSLVYGSFRIFNYFAELKIENLKLLADLSGILLSIIFIFVDWKKVFKKLRFHKI